MDHLDRLIASGVITVERELSTGVVRVKLTASAWESMLTSQEARAAHSPAATPLKPAPAHPRKGSIYED